MFTSKRHLLLLSFTIILSLLLSSCMLPVMRPIPTTPPVPSVSTSSTLASPSPSQQTTPRPSLPPSPLISTPPPVANDDSTTIMLYMCGSDLESLYGSASADLYEMMSADINPNVNLIIETGGAEEWHTQGISNRTNQRFQVISDSLLLLEDNLGARDMTDPETLADFIQYSSANFPASRYILILWDHGGGSLSGFGYDELFDASSYDSLTLDELQYALYLGGTYFDIIGFDACLMSTVETAVSLSDYSDYMLASQKLEPGCGWYYENWLTQLSAYPSIPSDQLAAIIIDDYIDAARYQDYFTELTLALIDLNAIDNLQQAILNFFSAANDDLLNGGFANISRTRADISGGMRSLDTDYDHIDLRYLAYSMANSQSDALVRALDDSIVYFNSHNTSNTGGLNIYFPYSDLSYFDDMVYLYDAIGMDPQYSSFFSNFVSVMLGGQSSDDDWSNYQWYDSELVSDYAVYYDEYYYDYSELEVYDKDGGYVLSLTDEDWELIVAIELQVLLDDGEGYLDLGSDNVFEFDDDGDLLILFDNTWVAIDGQVVPFYYESEIITADGFWYTYGSAPAIVNDEYADVIIMWDDYNPGGYIAGIRKNYFGAISQKGYSPLYIGDEITFIIDYYNYDMSYDDWYYFGDTIIISDEPEVSYEDIGFGDCLVNYMLTDIYGNQYWTETILFYD